MGWAGIICAATLWRRYGPSFIEPLLLGATAYTAGAAVQLAYRPQLIQGLIGPHELFHFAVVVGIALHWQFVYRLANGRDAATTTRSAIPVDALGARP